LATLEGQFVDLAWLLEDVVCWTLTDDGWQRVDDALLRLDYALGAGDEAQIGQETTALMLAGPRRAGRGVDDSMDRALRQPAPARTRDLVNMLVHRLGRAGTSEAAAPKPDNDEAGPGPR
jgi:hypothetical protein